ncbi:Sec23/Sec24 trunk domain-containing protein [Loa loa]|uniref:Sec23/Sec24 trunk domain-containing protein n=2 Tax=Loa loa TaxID=7209 RepID=A0A1S0TTI4_LOALO|nr:Sec23/Sec24 trunk domain-containing protein [Loa loa]EFO19073.1 Sec23/Sec24 trunk domain-containing protein [Loa loa]
MTGKMFLLKIIASQVSCNRPVLDMQFHHQWSVLALTKNQAVRMITTLRKWREVAHTGLQLLNFHKNQWPFQGGMRTTPTACNEGVARQSPFHSGTGAVPRRHCSAFRNLAQRFGGMYRTAVPSTFMQAGQPVGDHNVKGAVNEGRNYVTPDTTVPHNGQIPQNMMLQSGTVCGRNIGQQAFPPQCTANLEMNNGKTPMMTVNGGTHLISNLPSNSPNDVRQHAPFNPPHTNSELISAKISVPSTTIATLTPTQIGTAPSMQTFIGNIPSVPGAGTFPHMLPSHSLQQMAPSTEIVPPLPSMGFVPPPDPSMGQRYFGTHNIAPGIGGKAETKHTTFGGLTGIDTFPKAAGSSGPQMSMPPQIPGAYSNSPSGSLGLSSVPSAPPVNYGTGSTGTAEPSMRGEIIGPPAAGLYQQKPRLDPNLMPSVVQVIEEDRSTRSGTFPTGYPTAEHPPLTSTEFIAQDQGICSPKFMRSTLYVAPASSDMLKNSQMPFAVAVTPFARLHPDEMQLPIVDLGELGPVRCHRCKAYMCPFMEFQDGGRRFRCPFCFASTAVDDSYFAHLDHTGRRTDIQHRPEQYLGSYELVATKPYCKNGLKPKEPAFIFMLDVSYSAVQCGLVSIFCRNIRNLLDDLPKEVGQVKSSLRIGFATYDQTIHFYNLKSHIGQPEMLVVGDVDDVFVPLVDGFLVTLEEADVVLNSLLHEIEKIFGETRITETILGPVIQAGLDALKCADRAGKLFIFHTNLPSLDAPGKLKNRDDRKLLGTDKEKTVLQPHIDFYSKLGEECVKAGCAVDLFLFPNSFVDVASLSPVCSLTGGSIYKYQYFETQKDSERFLADLSHDISREIVFDVMIRVRTSTGLRPTGFFGSFFMDNSTDLEMGAIDCDQAVHVEIRHDDKLPEGSAYLQTAVLFTSCSGQRRLRIHNLALAVSSDYNQLYRVADLDCLTSFLFKQAEYVLRDKSPKEMREAVNARCAHMLATYREKCSEHAPLGQLILPECLKLLPLFANCIIKNDALSGGSDISVDDRAYLMHLIPSLRTEDALTLLYPTVFPISDLILEQQPTEITLPTCIRASYDNLLPEKAYMIFNGIMMFLWIGLKVPQDWVQDVFNSNSVAHLNVENHVVPERDNARSRAVRYVIERVNVNRLRHMKLFMIRQQDALEAWMKKFLVEDRTSSMPSYVEYLCNIHREIRGLLT